MNIDSMFDLPVEFIEFENSASVEAATAKQDHSIADIMVKAIRASNWYEQTNTIENLKATIDDAKLIPEHDSPLNILEIFNDDCLMLILKHLSLRDLCAVSEVCTKFKSNADKVFLLRFADLRILSDMAVNGIFVCSDGEVLFDGGISMALLEVLFHNFGPCMKSLHLDGTNWREEQIHRVFEILEKFGSSGAISTLKIEGYKVENVPNEMLKNLKCLTISSSDLCHGIANSLEVCRELIELHLIKSKNQQFIVGAMTPVQFMHGYGTEANNSSISHDRSSSNIFRSIGLNLQKLETIEIETFEESSMNSARDVIFLTRLKHLNTLSLDCSKLPITELLNALLVENIPIKDLSLFGFDLDPENASSLSMWTQMEKLKISGRNIESDQLPPIIKSMPHLKEIYLWSFDIDLEVVKDITATCKVLSLLECSIGLNSPKLTIEETDYVSFVDSVKNRYNDTKLLIRIDDSPWCRLKVPLEIIEENRQWLGIEIPESVDWSDDEDDDPELQKIMDEISIFL